MSSRPTLLVFTQAPAFLPSGAPLEPYEVTADTNCTFEVDARGRLIRKDRIDGTRWLSADYTGFFSVTNVPRYSQTPHMYQLSVVCGVVTRMHQVTPGAPSILVTAESMWALESMVIDHDAVSVSKTYKGCLQLIQDAELSLGFKTGDGKLDAMIAMALCRPELLQGKSARDALSSLDDHQLRAISAWHRAQLLD